MNITNDIFWSIYDCNANIFQEVELYDKLVTTFNKIKKILHLFQYQKVYNLILKKQCQKLKINERFYHQIEIFHNSTKQSR